MPSAATSLLLISLLVFCGMTLLVFAGSQMLARRERIRRRLAALSAIPADGGADSPTTDQPWITLDPARLGLDANAQRRLRAELIQAGFFAVSAVPTYAAIRILLLIATPLIGVLLLPLAFGTWGATERFALAAILLIVAYYLPQAYLSRRQRFLEQSYRLTFPDYLDMLVVCINAGLSLEAALDRAGRELDESDLEFRTNLDLMAGEMRAGKSTAEALKALADRLGLREARSFAALLQQTIELGTDIAQALTTFSDEMREKRMSSAEEKASALPPKLTLPLGLFIFPVVLITVLAPAVLKIMNVVKP